MVAITNRDEQNAAVASLAALEHVSGGRYNMVALWVKGKARVTGYNNVLRPSPDSYPDICGEHAELAMCLSAVRDQNRNEIRGGTVYVLGRKHGNQNPMMNTRPCRYCMAVLKLTKIRHLVYSHNGKLVKEAL